MLCTRTTLISRSRPVLCWTLALSLAPSPDLLAQALAPRAATATAINLSPSTAPAIAQPGVTVLNVTGSGYPAGAITAGQVTVMLEPATAGVGPTVMTAATAVTSIFGTSERVTFQVPAATSLSPNNAQIGVSLPVTISVPGASFSSGMQANFGAGISVGGATAGTFGSVNVQDSTTLTAQLTISPSAAAGKRPIALQNGTQQTAVPDGFFVLAPGSQATVADALSVAVPTRYSVSISGQTTAGLAFASSNKSALTINPSARIVSVAPASGTPGQSLAVTLTGEFTDFVQGSTQANFGAGISVGAATLGSYGDLTITSPMTATAQIAIAQGASSGPRTVMVRTGVQQASLINAFTVLGSTPIPVITSIAPNSGQQGQQNLSVLITGQNTHFVQGTTTASFGLGTTVASLTVNSPLSAVALINITPAASAGPRNVTLATGSEDAILPNGFTVTTPANQPPVVGVGPDQTLTQSWELLVAAYSMKSILRFNGLTGTFTDAFVPTGSGGLGVTNAAVAGPDGNLYVSTHDGVSGTGRVLKFNGATGAFMSTFVPVGSGGSTGFTYLIFGPDGNLYVSDWDAHGVKRYNGTTGAFIDLFASGPVAPQALVFGPDGDLYVADEVNGVYRFDGKTGASKGIFVAQGAGGLNEAVGLTFGSDGNLYVGGTLSHNVLRYSGSTGTFISAFVSSQSGGLDKPHGFAFGPDGNLYVGDEGGSGRVLRYNGKTGAFIDAFVPSGSGGMTGNSLALAGITFLPVARTTLTGSMVDDGLPSGSTLTGSWSKTTGPGPVAFGTPIVSVPNVGGKSNALTSPSSFTVPGTYTLTLNSSDSLSTAGASVNVIVKPPVAAPGQPELLSVSPNTGMQGQSLSVTLTGQNTHFAQGTTTASLGAGITIATLTVSSGTSATAVLNIDAGAAIGTRNVTLTTGSEVVTLASGFTVNPATPVLTQVTPNSGQQGQQTLAINIVGQNTHFVQGTTTANFGAGMSTASLTVNSPVSAVAVLNIGNSAALGPRSVTLTTGSEAVTLTNAFTVTAGNQPPVVSAGANQTITQAWELLISSNNCCTNKPLDEAVLRYDGTTGSFLGVVTPIRLSDGLSYPYHLYIDSANRLYVSVRGGLNGALGGIYRYDAGTGALIDKFIPLGAGGPGDAPSYAFGPDGNLYVGKESPANIARFNGTTGALIDRFATFPSTDPAVLGITFGPDNNLYAADAGSVLKFDGKTGALLGKFADTSSHGLSTANSPIFGPDGNLYVSGLDSANVARFNGATGAFIDTFVAPNSGGLVRSTQMQFGPDGNLYVTDLPAGSNSGQVLRYDGKTGKFIDVFIPRGSGGLLRAAGLIFHRVGGPATLSGTVTDDGLPVGGKLTAVWSKVSGPGVVTFANPNSAATTADFSAPGTYVLRLTASDSQLTSSSDVTIVVNGLTFGLNLGAQDLIVSYPDTNAVGRYDAQTGALKSSFITPVNPSTQSISAVQFGKDGNLYVSWETHYGNDPGGVLRYNAATGVLIDRFIDHGFASRGLVFGADGSLYEGRNADSQVAHYSASGSIIGLFVARVPRPENLLFTPQGDLLVGSSPSTSTGNVLLFDGNTGSLKATIAPGMPVPRGMAFGPDGNLYISFANVNNQPGSVKRFGPAGNLLGTFISGLHEPNDIAFGPGGNLYVVSSGVGVLVYDGSGAFLRNLIPATGNPVGSDPYKLTLTTSPLVAPPNNPPQNATILSVNPNAGQQGQQNLLVAITGQNTHFAQGLTQVSFGAGVAVGAVTVTSGTSLTAQIAIDPGAAGQRDVVTKTASESATLLGGFTILTSNYTPPSVSAGANQTIPRVLTPPITWSRSSTFAQAAGPIGSGAVVPAALLLPTDITDPAQVWDSTNRLGNPPPGTLWASWPGPACNSGYPSFGFHFRGTFTLDPSLLGLGLKSIRVFDPYKENGIIPINDALYLYLNGNFVIKRSATFLYAGDLPEYGTLGGDAFGDFKIAPEVGGSYVSSLLVPSTLATAGGNVIDIVGEDTCSAGGLGFLAVEVTSANSAQLDGSVSGTGPFAISWKQVSGPGTVKFQDPGLAKTTASFTAIGTYVLRLTADDSKTIAAADVTVTVQAVNNPPIVSAGANQTIVLPAGLKLTGTVADDGLPVGGKLSSVWRRVRGPFGVSFADPGSPATNASFSQPGDYVLRLTANDSILATSSEVTITVLGTGSAVLSSIRPDSGVTGAQSMMIDLIGQNTNFVPGTTTVDFGAGITVASVTVRSSTTASVVINIDPAASVGPRAITVKTNSEVLSRANVFTVLSRSGPSITSISPNSGLQGSGGPIGIVGLNTNFVQGTTQLDFGPGIAVGSIAVTCATCLTAQVALAPDAAPGPRTATVTTGAEVVALPNAFTVVPATPILTSLKPAGGQQGQTVTSTITGNFTHFAQGVTQISLGSGVTTGMITVSSPTSLTAQFIIDPNATVGTRTLTVTTGTEVVSVPNVFNIVTAGTPIFTSISPGGGFQGQTLSLTLTGQSTHFAQGSTQVNLGAGITIGALAVANPTNLTAQITIAPNATLGARTTTITTGTEVVSLSGFTVQQGAFILTLDPGGAAQGQTLSVAIAGQLTNFVQGTTQANFGPGISVGGGPVGGLGAVTVTSPTTATAQVVVSPAATIGPRDVVVQTGAEQATFPAGFAVVAPPLLTLANPNTGQAGQSLSVAVTGQNSHFVQGASLVDFGPGITVNTVAVSSAINLTAQIVISASAALGARQIVVTTNGEVAPSSSSAFTVGTSGTPATLSLNPNTGRQAQQNLSVTITGQGTNFAQGASQVSFGAGVTVGTVTVASSGSLTAQISVSANAPLGARTVTVTTGTEVASLLANAFSVTSAVNQSPVITIAPTFSVTLPNRLTATYTVTDDGLPSGGALTVSWDTISTPPGATVGYQNQTLSSISVGFDTAGTYTLRITATDTQFTVFKDITVTVSASSISPPTVSIAAPADGSEVTGPVNVTGSVGGQFLSKWALEYQAPGDTIYRTFATGTTPVANGILGTFDPTVLLNGTAYIRLTATDTGGQSATAGPISLALTKNQKIGNFTVSFNDLSIPVAGLPIQIVRTYDSRRRLIPGSDFSYGWTLDINTVRVSESVIAGDLWNATTTGGTFPTYCLQPAKPHVVTVSLPDGTTYTYDLKLTPQCQQFVPPDQVAISFAPRPGTTASLAVLGNNLTTVSASFPGAAQLFDLDTGQVFDPAKYRLTLADGRALDINPATGLEKMTDLNGNTLTITPSGIIHSSGKSVAFTRNAAHLITKITDPLGNSINYAYDALTGDLTSVTDRSNLTTTYTYNADHGLLTIKDPRGVQPIRNVYDSNGRLIQHIDAFGNTINYTHNTGSRQEIITDRLGNVTVNEYDTDGNVVKVTDALGGVTQRTYDSRGNVLTETNALSKTRTYTYDANNNRLTETDPLGGTTTYTYNGRNQALTITDALSRVTTNTYDANGNLLSTKDPVGNVTSYAYNSSGLQTSTTDALGNVTGNLYDASGNLTKLTDALGNVIAYTYDANGNKLNETKTRTTVSGPETVVTSYQYDASSRLTRTTYPDGSTTQIKYNAIGKQSVTIDQLGRQTSYQYDLMGRLTQTTYPDGTSETSTYDAEGDRITSTDRASRTTTYVYDALKRLTQTIHPDNASTTTTYDAIGEVIASKDPLGHTTQYGYDAAGRRTKLTDALGHVTTFAFDIVGNQLSVTDANGNTTQYQYGNDNRRIKTIYPDTTNDSVTYDALGRSITKTDQAGKTTQFQYDKLGRLTQVTDALNQTTKYTYDEVGNRLTQTDANNHTTTFAYDKRGRRTRRTLPLGMFETNTYDLAGNLITKTDFNGKATTYAYDAVNRLVSKTPDPSLGEPTDTFTYTALGQRQTMVDASGTTSYSYDVRGRLLTKATPQGTLTYTYDAGGNLTSIRSSNSGGTSVNYAYDALNRLSTVTDNRLASGITTYTYDNAGNLSGYLYPNGVQSTYTYNQLNRLTNLAISKGSTLASYAYTLGPAGNRTAVAEFGGRQVNYAYDALFRLTGETIAGGAVNGAIGYTYDAVGNRLARASSVAPVPAAAYAYDANDRLTADTYDNNGSTTTSGGNTYAYDFENHLKSQAGGASVTVVYDGDGNRVAETTGGTTTKYLVDNRNLTGYAQVLDELVGGAVQRVYSYGLNRISQSQASGASFYGYDGHGSVRILTGASGAITDRGDYDAFGNITSQTGFTAGRYLFAAEQYDSDLALYYERARYLDPASGRFRTMDTFEGIVDNPSAGHKYGYTANDPIDRSDPSGQAFDLPSTVLASALGGALQGAVVGYVGGGSSGAIHGFVQGAVFGAVFPVAGAAIGTALLGNAARGVFLVGLGGLTSSVAVSGYYAIAAPTTQVRNIALANVFATVGFMYFGPKVLEASNTTTLQAEAANQSFTASFTASGRPPQPPWAPGTVITETTLFAPRVYVRVYSSGTTEPVGAWLADASEIQGLTAAEVQSRLSLPFRPSHVTTVSVPAGTTFRTGFANPDAFGGDGYGFQAQLLTEIPNSSFGPGTRLP